MKHCKLIVLCISSIAIVICAVMIIRINVLYPNAEVMKRLAKDKMLRALSNVAYAKGDYEKEMGQAALLNESLNYRNT